MGQSTNGLLAFGWSIDEDEESAIVPEEDQEDWSDLDTWWDERLATLAGLEADAPYAKRREVEEACPLELVRHCSGEYTMFIVSHRQHNFSARRGYPRVIAPGDLIVPAHDVQEMHDWADKLKLKLDGEPAWYLASMWW